MNKIFFDINTFWFYAVLLHIAGSVVFSVMGILPLGDLLCLTGMWVFYLYQSEKSKKEIRIASFGWIISCLLLFWTPASYRSSFFMNALMLLLVYYVCQKRNVSIWHYCSFQKISIKQWLIVFFCSVTFMILASYVNAVSMLFVNNMTAASLQDAGKYLPQSILVFAILPAATEEIMFRGYIFRSISHKKTAILLSACMFALLHMNFNQMSYAFIMGLLFASLVSITDNLSMTVMVHLLFNCYNILLSAFPQNAMTILIQNIQIAGYRMMAPSFYKEAGSFSGQLFLTGSIVSLGVLFLTLLLFLYLKMKGKKTEEKDMEKGLLWRPNKVFWAACFICLLVAVSYEYMI